MAALACRTITACGVDFRIIRTPDTLPGLQADTVDLVIWAHTDVPERDMPDALERLRVMLDQHIRDFRAKQRKGGE